MSRIVVSFSDKGREHLFRACAIVELLANHHDLLLIAPRTLHRPIADLCRKHRRVELYIASPPEVPTGFRDSSRWGHESAASWQRYCLTENKVQRYSPDLLISGAESQLPRIGKKLGIRCIRIDYHHFLDDIDLRAVPLASRLPLMVSNFARRVLTPTVDEQIVSSVHPYPLRDFSQIRYRRPHRRVGVLLREELQKVRRQEKHLLVKIAGKNTHWLEELAKIRLPAKVYGVNHADRLGNLEFQNSADTFAEDLLSCAGVVTDVGNQLIGEALACGKQVLAIPDPNDYHQRISALFLSRCELTGAMVAPVLTAQLISDFYDNASPQKLANSHIPIANHDVKTFIELQLNQAQ